MQAKEHNAVAQDIIDVVGAVVEDKAQGQTALAIKETVATRLADNPAYAPLWVQFQADPQTNRPALVGILQVILHGDQALADRLEALLARYAQRQEATPTIKAEGAYFAGQVQVNHGDVVGRDQTKTIYNAGGDPETLANAFAALYQQVAQKPDLAPQEKADVQAELQEVEQELQKGEQADETFIQRRLRNVKRMAPDILDVVLTTFANPVLGMGMVAKKVAEKMKAEAR
jgi:DNA-binding transcriptional regulator YbjK